MVKWQRGSLGELIPEIERTITETPGLALLSAMLTMASAESGDHERARRLLSDFGTAGFDLPLDVTWLSGMVEYAEAAVQCGDRTCAAPLLDRLQPWADQMAVCCLGTAEGPVGTFVGGLAMVLGHYDEAAHYFSRAAAFSQAAGASFYGARTHLWWGKMLAQRNAPRDSERARDLLTEAHTVALANGYSNVERRAAAALVALS
jgi:hypothetical protein